MGGVRSISVAQGGGGDPPPCLADVCVHPSCIPSAGQVGARWV